MVAYVIIVVVILVPLMIFVAVGSGFLTLKDSGIARKRKNMGCTVEYMTVKQENGLTYNMSRVLDANGAPLTDWESFTPTSAPNAEMWHLARGKDIR